VTPGGPASQNGFPAPTPFDHCVGTQQKRFRDRKPNCFRGLEIDSQIKLRGLLHRDFFRLLALQYRLHKLGAMILGLGLGRTKAIVLVLVSCRFPLTILVASFEMTGVESAGGIRSNEIS
jgi:hypothetical protein